jgi:peptidoglycan/xylan/chitin deacetylase (PgdA/CDA1 family)
VIFLVATLIRSGRRLPWWDRWGAEILAAGKGTANAITDYGARCAAQKNGCRGLDRDHDNHQTDGEPLYLSRAELLSGHPAFYVANHTAQHANLARLSEQEIAEDVDAGERAISDLPGYLPLLAYPFGSYDDRVLAAVRARPHIRFAFATGRGSRTETSCLRRVNLNTPSFALFAAESAGIFDCFKRGAFQLWHGS